MYRRLSALSVGILLCTVAACGRAGELTGPGDPIQASGSAVYDSDGGMFGNGNYDGGAGEGGSAGSGGRAIGDLDGGLPTLDNEEGQSSSREDGGMFGNGN